MPTPAWFGRLPLVAGKRTVAVDNNVLSAYLFESGSGDDVRAVFEHPGVRAQIGRQVIDEALNHPGLDAERRRIAWERLGRLQTEGRVLLSGASQMTPATRAACTELSRLLTAARVSAEDARMFFDAPVKRLPVFTRDVRARNALAAAFSNPAVRAFLAGHGLPTAVSEVLVG